MSIGSILNIGAQAMSAQQIAVQIASQNIANATTAGYSRQRVELQAALPTVFPYGSIGTGVDDRRHHARARRAARHDVSQRRRRRRRRATRRARALVADSRRSSASRATRA